ncbi:cuticle protein precursor [Tribolium castaneum]|uniref:Cuticle protein n=1 Tax=Tribolium castaneum TaxID=7070 RepID=D6WIF2_TRICA|nr:cuticle protein precursor [Tribolium castaneum]AEG74042.1 cuticle protein [Tribolium castaneum]EEZ99677.1 Cuticle protein 19-like Protein [Tribolium castaneum]|eukprot:NP_001280525.1 cuticle protein precursor [Tribolium castaneum]
MHGGAVLALLVLAVASVSAQGGEGYGHHHLEEYIDYRARPRYHYDYNVHDHHTHDFHHQWEHRDGKEVKGEYSLIQPDGRRRTVEYRAGKHGADYRIKYEGHSHHGGIGSFGIGGN